MHPDGEIVAWPGSQRLVLVLVLVLERGGMRGRALEHPAPTVSGSRPEQSNGHEWSCLWR